MFYFAIAVCIVSLSSAVVDKCCAPLKWSGLETMIIATIPSNGSVPTLTKSGYYLSVDYGRRIISATGTMTIDDVPTNITALTDYNKMKTYSVVNGKCTITDPGPYPGNCIPANASVTGRGFLGVGLGKMNVAQYKLQENNMTTYITVTDNCIPLALTSVGHNQDGAYVMSSGGFTGIKDSILDESVFSLPAECSGNAMSPDGVIIGKRGFV